MFKPNCNPKPVILGFTLTGVFLIFKYLTILSMETEAGTRKRKRKEAQKRIFKKY